MCFREKTKNLQFEYTDSQHVEPIEEARLDAPT